MEIIGASNRLGNNKLTSMSSEYHLVNKSIKLSLSLDIDPYFMQLHFYWVLGMFQNVYIQYPTTACPYTVLE